MNYCSHCGSDKLERLIPEGDHLPRIVCQNCQSIHYLNPKLIVGCLITNERKEVMLCRRGIEPRLGFWNIPAGFLENKESVEAGAIREVLEETGAKVRITKLHSIYNVLKADQVYLIFAAEMLHPHYETTPESTEIEFFAKDSIPWDEIAFSSNIHALKHWIAIENGAPDELVTGTLELN